MLPQTLAARGIPYQHFPMAPDGLPDEGFEQRWALISPGLRDMLRAGGKLLIHCSDGMLRSGCLRACCSVELAAAGGCAQPRAGRARRRARPPRAAQLPAAPGCSCRAPTWPFPHCIPRSRRRSAPRRHRRPRTSCRRSPSTASRNSPGGARTRRAPWSSVRVPAEPLEAAPQGSNQYSPSAWPWLLCAPGSRDCQMRHSSADLAEGPLPTVSSSVPRTP